MAFVPYYILVMFGLILLDYSFAIFIEKHQDYKKAILYVSIAFTLFTLIKTLFTFNFDILRNN